MKKCANSILLGLSLLSFSFVTEPHSHSNLISGNITIDNLQRTYLINLPVYNTDKPRALVFVLHGAGASAELCERLYGWTSKSNAENFIVVYPDGIPGTKPLKLRTWNAGRCCHYASENNIDDVKFISELIDQLKSQYQIDERKIFITGMSNGSMMVYRLACEIPEKITAIAAVSGPLMTAKPCNPSHPLPVLHIHSAIDTKVPYAGGAGILRNQFSSVDSTLNVWVSANHCQNTLPVVTQEDQYTMYQWNTCNAPIESYITKDGGHSWPGGTKPRPTADRPSQAFNATDLIWEFFKGQSQ